jgi:sugar phosphate isomerase/epimerase
MIDVDLIAAHWTIAGNAIPGTEQDYSPFGFQDRVEQAAKAGFKGMGLWHRDVAHVLQKHSLQEMKRILEDNGMKYIELTVLLDWFMEPGERRKASDDRRKFFLSVAETIGLWNLRVSDSRRTPCPPERLAEEFALLCKEAALRGARVTYEISPFSNVDSLQSALRMVKSAGAKNGGILFDIWHIVKLGIPFEKVWEFPSEHFFGLEINDGYVHNPPTPDLMQETANHRRLCGDGEFDLKGFLAYLPKSQYTGPVGVEVCSQELRSLPLNEAARQAYETAMAQMPI